MNRKIMLVDDEPSELVMYSRLLQGEFRIETAASGEDGLALLHKRSPFAVVISDMEMAGMDGVRFLRRVHQVAPNTVRLLLTGHIDLKGAVDAVNEGCIFRLLLKPCGRTELIAAVHSALDCYNEKKEERVRIELPVQVCRSLQSTELHSAHTADISPSGARLAGLQTQLEPGEEFELHCYGKKAPYKVVWSGVPGTEAEGEAGVKCLALEANIWRMDHWHVEQAEALERARDVQLRLLPQEKPPLKTLEYTGHCVQARMVGGDYYDFLDMGPGEVGFALADVAGKGIPAALLTASLQGSLHSLYGANSKNLTRLLTSMNLNLYKHTTQDRYATFFFGHYTEGTRSIQYVNCGHNAPLVLRGSGAVERLSGTATVLGLFSDWSCSSEVIQLEPGDIFCMYTDGITETKSRTGEEFGESRLLESLRASRNLGVTDILRNIRNAVEHFGYGEQQDDLTLVIGRVTNFQF